MSVALKGNEVECGSTLQNITVPGTGDSEPSLQRSYYQYLPTSLCGDQADDVDTVLPLVFVVHCFGCTAENMLFWQQVAERYNFVMVVPQGIERSFNARYCCGKAMTDNVDDVGFFVTTIQSLSAKYTFVNKDVTYAVGWSNGGYMVTYAARLFRAIAPISGYQYDDLGDATNHQPVALFMHHSTNDKNVRFTGCCTDRDMPMCCCRISSPPTAPDTCASVPTIYDRWATQVNGCDDDDNSDTVVVSYSDDERGISCTTSQGCRANTTLCTHSVGAHFNVPSHEEAFPMVEEIAGFFAENACSINGGTWSWAEARCSCNDSANLRAYCLTISKQDYKKEYTAKTSQVTALSKSKHVQETRSDDSAVSMLVLATLGVGICMLGLYFFRRRRRQQKRYGGFQKVATTVELASV